LILKEKLLYLTQKYPEFLKNGKTILGLPKSLFKLFDLIEEI